ncbi:MAG: glycosyltransferase family 4 protein, partial [Gemmatimonadales bacterium]
DAIDLRKAPFVEQPALLAAAAVAVSPRVRCDGIPQKLLNYMAAGLPIVAFDGSAGPLRHEATGLRVPGGDPVALAGAIERLLDDGALARALGDAAREEVRREFTWANVAARVEQVYRDTIADAGTAREG